MTDDQHRIGKLNAAKLVVVDALERWDAKTPADRPDPIAVGTWVLEQLQTAHGWRPPLDPTDVPPLRPARAAGDDSPGRREFHAARAALSARRTNRPTTSDTP